MSTTHQAGPSHEQIMAELLALRLENAKLKSGSHGTIKVSEKGAVSVYGLGRFPVTLFRSQWEALIKRVPEIEAFIAANADKLSVKPKTP